LIIYVVVHLELDSTFFKAVRLAGSVVELDFVPLNQIDSSQ